MSGTSNDILQLLLAEIEADPGAAVFPNLAEAYRRVGRPERAREIAANGLHHAPERMAGRVALGLALLDVGRADDAREVLSAILEDVPELMALLQTEAAPAESALEDRPWPEDLVPQSAPDERTEQALPGAVGDDEIEHAFEEAEAQPDEMIDVNDVAEAALREERLDEPEVGFAPGEHPVFATATMANLLERQGDSQGAARIRSSLAGPDAHALRAADEAAGTEREDPLAAVAEDAGAGWPEMDAAEAPEVAPAAVETAAPETLAEAQDAEDAKARKARIISTLEGWLENIRRDVA